MKKDMQLGRSAKVAPPGAFTAEEYAAQFQIAVKTAREELLHLFKTGRVDRVRQCGGFLYWKVKK